MYEPEIVKAMSVEQLLDAARERVDMTWDQVAEKSGLSVAGLRRIRNGEGRPRAESLNRLEHTLQLPHGTIRKKFPPGNSVPTTQQLLYGDQRPDFVIRLGDSAALLIEVKKYQVGGLTEAALADIVEQLGRYATFLLQEARREQIEWKQKEEAESGNL